MKALAWILCIAAAAVAGFVFWAAPHRDHARPTAASGPTGLTRPAYPVLLKHALAGATSIEIRNSGGITTLVRRPTTVRRIVGWFAALPHPRPQRVSHSDSAWCSGYRPLVARFDFRGAGGGVLLRAADRLPGPFAGACDGSISFEGRALSDDGFLARVSTNVGVDLSANRRTLQHEEAAKRDTRKLLESVRVPPGSRLVASSNPVITGPSANTVSASRTWRVHLPQPQVYRWERAHPPRGSGPGEFSGLVGWNSNHGRPIKDRAADYSYYALAGRTYQRDLHLDLWHFVQHGAWTRIEADVYERWIVARPSDEKIPGGVRSIVIHGPARLARRVTRPDLVARIVGWVNSVPIIQSFSGECGLMSPSPEVRVDFVGADNATLATASAAEAGAVEGRCNPLDFSVGGRREPPLDGGGDPIGQIQRLLR